MSFRLRAAIAVLLFLVLANIGWRIWTRWGLITIHGDNVPLSKVIRSIERQGGINLVSNAGPDATVTMHVRQVPLSRALQVLSINTGGRWSLGYVVAPDKAAIRGFLDAFANGGETADWKKFAISGGGMPGGSGASDPREDPWITSPPGEPKLQSYLEQGAQYVNAQFWAPAEWNPAIARPPAASGPGQVTRDLASSAHGESREVFFLSMPAAAPGKTTAEGSPAGPPRDDPAESGPGGMPNAAAAKAMELREQARIDRLPAARRAEARAKFDERKKIFADMKNLSPEERREKMQARIEEDMRSSGPSPFETRMTQMDAMHTAEQRANFFRMVVKFKEGASK